MPLSQLNWASWTKLWISRSAVKSSDLVVLATPVDVICTLLPKALDLLSPTSMLVDLGSTKKGFQSI